jgi:hypothetical protein
MNSEKPTKDNGMKGGGSDAASRISAAIGDVSGVKPVHLWHPPYCGEIDMRIAADGRWFYQGSLIQRAAMVRLFASILRKDPDRYVLVTPVEMVGITVEDVPFAAVELQRMPTEAGCELRIRTSLDDWITVDETHALEFRTDSTAGLKPYVHVRDGLLARFTRSLAHELLDLAEVRELQGVDVLGVASGLSFFPIVPANQAAGDAT